MIKNITIDEWQSFIENKSDTTIFHHREWISHLNSHYKYKLLIIGVFENEKLVGAVPFLNTRTISGKKKLISLPFSDEVALLIPQNNIDEFLNHINTSLSHDYYQIELKYEIENIALNHIEQNYVIHKLELCTDYKQIFNNFKKKQVQNAINKSIQTGVIVKKHTDIEGVEIFYKMHQRIRKKYGTPVQSKKYFYSLKKYLFDNNLGFINIAYYNSKPIAAHVYLTYNETIVYKYSASDYKYLHLSANNLVLWDTIKWACVNGYNQLDFGVSHKDNIGLRKFKSGWGSEEKLCSYTYLISNNKSSENKANKFKLLRVFIKIAPLFVNRLLGKLFYKYAA